MELLNYNEIKSSNFWVVPDGGSFTFGIETHSGQKFDILITQSVDLEDYLEDAIPGRIYINEKLIDLKSEEEASVLSILAHMLENDELGHKQGLAVFIVKRILHFFASGEAERVHALLQNNPE